MFSLTRLAKIGYLLIFTLVVFLLVSAKPSPAQFGAPAFGVSAGFRGTPGLPTIAVPIISGSGSASAGGSAGGAFGLTGGSVGGSVSGSFSTQIIYINFGAFFPNNGRIIGPPMPTMMPMLNNMFFAGFLFNPFTADTTGAPWSMLLAMNMGGGVAPTGTIIPSGMAGGFAGIAGGIGGFGAGGIMGGFGGMGGFAGKGFGGFNGRKGL
jgi:hypothetical protein